MLFNSYLFLLVFLPLALIPYWLLRHHRLARHCWLLTVNAFFYAYWDYRYLFILLAVTMTSFVAGRQIAIGRRKRAWLAVALSVNLGLLGFFKYYHFFANSVNSTADHSLLPFLHIILPIGISFYVFQAISYVLDIYRDDGAAAPSLLSLGLYLSLFPQVLAGPLVRYTDLQPALAAADIQLTRSRLDRAVIFFVLGLAKKVILADQLAVMVDPLAAHAADLRFFGSWLFAFGYTFQLYFDFSGYSDMAVGLACLLGYDLPRNFNAPYTAQNVAEFWRRWHMTLSNWFNVYVFLPLSRSLLRRWQARLTVMVCAYLVTMSLSGLWHGAAWNFIVWGAYYGVLLAAFQLWRYYRLPAWHPLLAQTATFGAVLLGWVMFRTTSLNEALSVYRSMLGLQGIESLAAVNLLPGVNYYMLCLLMLAFGITHSRMDTWEVAEHKLGWLGWWLGLLFVVCLMLLGQAGQFVYFQF